MSEDATRALHIHSFEVGRFLVRVTEGPDAPKEIESTEGELTVGTAKGNELVLSDGAVSRHHCILKATPDGIQVSDLGSTNGTRLDGTRILSAYIKPGKRLVVGTSALQLEVLDSDLPELSADSKFGNLLGESPQMRRLFALLPRLSQANATVLIQGETGTGKGAVAETVHQASSRADKPFVVVDCGAIPPNLLESELFGHVKGSFTGAHTDKVGLIEEAHGGTIFFDEIGELPLQLQPKLLRFLENKTIRRVGSSKSTDVDARVVAATNRDLRRAVNAERFRSDLFYRLNTVRITIPPLRERNEDIPLLVKHFYKRFADDSPAFTVSELSALLQRGEWRGNVRELRAAVERSLLFGDIGDFDALSDNRTSEEELSYREAKAQVVQRWEKTYLRELMTKHEENLSRVARAAKMDRTYLRQRLKALGLRD